MVVVGNVWRDRVKGGRVEVERSGDGKRES